MSKITWGNVISKTGDFLLLDVHRLMENFQNEVTHFFVWTWNKWNRIRVGSHVLDDPSLALLLKRPMKGGTTKDESG